MWEWEVIAAVALSMVEVVTLSAHTKLLNPTLITLMRDLLLGRFAVPTFLHPHPPGPTKGLSLGLLGRLSEHLPATRQDRPSHGPPYGDRIVPSSLYTIHMPPQDEMAQQSTPPYIPAKRMDAAASSSSLWVCYDQRPHPPDQQPHVEKEVQEALSDGGRVLSLLSLHRLHRGVFLHVSY